jgi:hypothetical protein
MHTIERIIFSAGTMITSTIVAVTLAKSKHAYSIRKEKNQQKQYYTEKGV